IPKRQKKTYKLVFSMSPTSFSPVIVSSLSTLILANPSFIRLTSAVYLDECPVQAEIPIYLIVLGVLQLVVMFTAGCCNPLKPDSLKKPKLTWIIWRSILTMFFFCWFITGNVWIYSIYEPSYNKNTTDVNSYCNKTVYLLSFWITTLVYILLGLFLLAGCLLLSALCQPVCI
uniref:Uncharacterized protein n=1 Tax=Fundulus heteroclitus TaxID=8078 RepID=A0A3Q2Q9U1_FUNHE